MHYTGNQRRSNRSRPLNITSSRFLKSTSSETLVPIPDDIDEVLYSQGEPYSEEPCDDRSRELDDSTQHDKRPQIQTHEKYRSHEQEKHFNRSRQSKSNSRCLQFTSSHQVPPFWITWMYPYPLPG